MSALPQGLGIRAGNKDHGRERGGRTAPAAQQLAGMGKGRPKHSRAPAQGWVAG